MIKRVELYIDAFRNCQLVMNDLDVEEIYADIKSVIKTKYELVRLLIDPFMLKDHREEIRKKKLTSELEQEQDMLLTEVEAKLTKANLEMRAEDKSKTSSKENNQENETPIIRDIDLLREKLNETQRKVIDLTFEAILKDNKKKILKRSLSNRADVDETVIDSELGRLGGSVFYTVSDGYGKDICGLNFVGLLLTDRGRELERLIILYLGFARKKFKSNDEIESVELKEFAQELKLSSEEYKLLDLCFDLDHNPFGSIGNCSRDDPKVMLPKSITRLGRLEPKDIEGFFHNELNNKIKEKVPTEAYMQTLANKKKSLVSKNNPFKAEPQKNVFNSQKAGVQRGNVEGQGKMKTINWLQLTDLHRGMSEQQSLWSTVREEFYRDLEMMGKNNGLWDLVLFTGDLVQYGKEEEFNMLEETLGELWEKFIELGCNPLLLTVPGNHDLFRPNSKSAIVKAFNSWEIDEDIRNEFWSNKDSDYREAVEEAFINYEKWIESTSLPLASRDNRCQYQKGLLPGDFSASIEIDNTRIGIVGVNTTFLQLRGGDFEKKLDIDVRQLQGACLGDVNRWLKRNNINVLMTHQPSSWLCGRGLEHFKENILGRDNFAFHICGHMHEGSSAEIRTGGGVAQRTIQGTSLFGIETWGEEKKQQRLHGYNIVNMDISSESADIKLWPRLLKKPKGGYYSIRPDDVHYQLEGKDFTDVTIPIRKNIVVSEEKKLLLPHVKVGEKKEVKDIVFLEPLKASLDFSKTPKRDSNGTLVEGYLYNCSLSVVLYAEKFVDGIVVIPGHRSGVYIEVPNIVEKTFVKGVYFDKVGEGSLVQVNNNTEAQITGDGSFEVYSNLDMVFRDRVISVSDKNCPVFGLPVSEILVWLSLWLSGKSKAVEVEVKIPLHECGGYHFGNGW